MRRVFNLFFVAIVVVTLATPSAFAARAVDGERRERPSITQLIRKLVHKIMGDEIVQPKP